jgi:hypothetical protein
MSDVDLVLAWNAAAVVFDDATRTLNTVTDNLEITEACRKALMNATGEMVELGKEAARRNLVLTRRVRS